MSKLFIVLGSLNAFLAVSLGAFGAHGLKHSLTSDLLAIYQTGVQYHFIHALGLLCVGILAQNWADSLYLKMAGGLLLTGILLFSGSLGIRSFGIITPLGGIALLGGWILLATAALKI
ncbi:MAG: hypothetical protein BWK79_09955 [Beggiatoa sp. IS2]|nr:MAG: hypothetical protein BWK79_09955 [Beggiatoa sp. IS2]